MKKMLAISAIILLSAVAANAESGLCQLSMTAFANNYSTTQGANAGTASATANNEKATDKSVKDSRVTGEAGKTSVSQSAHDSGFILPTFNVLGGVIVG